MARRERLVIAVVHTAASPCRCHASILPGIRRLGHRGFEVDADALPEALPRLVAADLVFDHTDTFRGEGTRGASLRAPRAGAAARVAGGAAGAAAAADDEGAARARLEAAGVPVPRGTVLWTARERIPSRLAPPLVVKGAYEHGSRGLVYADTLAEARRGAAALLARRVPAVVEEFVPGREVTVSLVGDPLRALPPLDVSLPSTRGEASIHSFGRKWKGHSGPGAPRGRLAEADLTPAARRALVALALRAARALGLSVYARFDVRIRPDGRPAFLEANVRPSLERGADLSVAAALAGLSYEDLLARIVAVAVATAPRRAGRPS